MWRFWIVGVCFCGISSQPAAHSDVDVHNYGESDGSDDGGYSDSDNGSTIDNNSGYAKNQVNSGTLAQREHGIVQVDSKESGNHDGGEYANQENQNNFGIGIKHNSSKEKDTGKDRDIDTDMGIAQWPYSCFFMLNCFWSFFC